VLLGDAPRISRLTGGAARHKIFQNRHIPQQANGQQEVVRSCPPGVPWIVREKVVGKRLTADLCQAGGSRQMAGANPMPFHVRTPRCVWSMTSGQRTCYGQPLLQSEATAKATAGTCRPLARERADDPGYCRRRQDQIESYRVVEADLELLCNSWSAGILENGNRPSAAASDSSIQYVTVR